MKEKTANNLFLCYRPSCRPLQLVEERGGGLSVPSLREQSVLTDGLYPYR